MGVNYHNVSEVKDVVAVLAARWRMPRRMQGALLPEAWEKLVGGMIAKHSRPLTLRKGELLLAVDSAAWMSELRFQVPALLARLKEQLGAGKIKSIELRVTPLPFIEATGEPTPPALPKADRRTETRASEIASQTDDAELAEVIRRAIIHSARLRRARDAHSRARKNRTEAPPAKS